MIFCKKIHPSFVNRTLYLIPKKTYPFHWNNLITEVSFIEGKFFNPSRYKWTISYSDYHGTVILAQGFAGSESAALQVINETIDEIKKDFKLLHGEE